MRGRKDRGGIFFRALDYRGLRSRRLGMVQDAGHGATLSMIDPNAALNTMLQIGLLIGVAIYGVPMVIAAWNLLQ